MIRALLLVLCLPAVAGADCGVLYRQQVRSYYYAPYVQQYAVQPVYYGVGESIRLDAIAEKIAARVEQRLGQRLAQQQHTSVNLAAFQKCAKCHATADKTGLALDGGPLDVWSYIRWEEMALDNRNIPPEMAPLMQSLSREERIAIHTAMRQLVAPARQPQPPPDPYPVPPPDENGGLQ